MLKNVARVYVFFHSASAFPVAGVLYLFTAGPTLGNLGGSAAFHGVLRVALQININQT
jgi:hypothetical protein